MSFGQQSGPPATGRQVQELLQLVQDAGHAGFRDARGALGLTQRQAGGKFTRGEADALIEQLQGSGEAGGGGNGDGGGPVAPTVRLTAAARALRSMRAEDLAAELQRRGWVVMEP